MGEKIDKANGDQTASYFSLVALADLPLNLFRPFQFRQIVKIRRSC